MSAPKCARAAPARADGDPRIVEHLQTPQSGGRKSRDKGNRAERALVRFFQDHGFAAERVPLSGAAGGSYLGDMTLPLLGADHVVEVKARADGFRELYKWLDGRDLLIVKADRREPLVVVPLALAAKIALAAESAKGGTL
jgi:Holliday junction resolvase